MRWPTGGGVSIWGGGHPGRYGRVWDGLQCCGHSWGGLERRGRSCGGLQGAGGRCGRPCEGLGDLTDNRPAKTQSAPDGGVAEGEGDQATLIRIHSAHGDALYEQKVH